MDENVTGPGDWEYKEEEKSMVRSVTYFVSEEFNEATYQSCKNVQFPAQSDTVMGLLCGPWGSKKCTAKRWFDYMGSITNGFSPFQISYEYGGASAVAGAGGARREPREASGGLKRTVLHLEST